MRRHGLRSILRRAVVERALDEAHNEITRRRGYELARVGFFNSTDFIIAPPMDASEFCAAMMKLGGVSRVDD